MPEPVFMTLGMCIMTSEPISTAYFIIPSDQFVCLHVYSPIVARQRLCENITAKTNTQATIEELLDASFYMRFMYQEKWASSSSKNFLLFFQNKESRLKTSVQISDLWDLNPRHPEYANHCTALSDGSTRVLQTRADSSARLLSVSKEEHWFINQNESSKEADFVTLQIITHKSRTDDLVWL
jgi:hypothetical protein